MPIVSSIGYPLTSQQNGTRVRLEVAGTVPVLVQVGDPSQTWASGTYIEVVRVGVDTPVQFSSFDGSVNVNLLSGTASLNDGEYGRVSLVSPGVWDLHVYKLSNVVKPAPLSVIDDASTVRDFGSSADHNTSVRMTSSSPITVVVQPEEFFGGSDPYYANNFNPLSPGSMPVGGSALFGKHGAGNITFVAGTGVTLNYPDSLTVSKLNAKVTLMKVGLNVWDLDGHFDLA